MKLGPLEIFGVTMLLSSAGCAQEEARDPSVYTRSRIELLKKRAGFDLDCAEDALTVSSLDDSRNNTRPIVLAGVVGCGRKAAFVFIPEREVWLRDGDVVTIGAPPVYPPPPR